MSNTVRHSDTNPSICFVVTNRVMVNLLTSTGPPAMGGAELQLYLFGRALKKKGWRVSYLVGDCGQPQALETAGGLSVLRAYGRADNRPAWQTLFRSLPEFWRSLAKVNADIYISRGLTGQAGVIRALTRLLRRRYIFWFGKNADAKYGVLRLSPLPLLERLLAWYAIHYTDAVVVQTNDQRRLLREYVGREGVVIPNVSPWQDAAPDGQPGEYALWIGSIQPKKRPHMLLDVAAQVPEVRFVMAGGEVPAYAELYDSVKTRAEQTKNVDFLGFVPYEQTKGLFQHAAVLASTSNAEEEGFPNVFLQAWSTGTPVVTTCDPDEVICRHGLGYHCEEASEIAEGIREIAASHQVQQEIGQRAYRYVSTHHSLKSVTAELNDFLQELINSENTGHRDDKDA